MPPVVFTCARSSYKGKLPIVDLTPPGKEGFSLIFAPNVPEFGLLRQARAAWEAAQKEARSFGKSLSTGLLFRDDARAREQVLANAEINEHNAWLNFRDAYVKQIQHEWYARQRVFVDLVRDAERPGGIVIVDTTSDNWTSPMLEKSPRQLFARRILQDSKTLQSFGVVYRGEVKT